MTTQTFIKPETKTRVLIADDHPVVRDGLRLIIENMAGVEVVGEAEDGHQAITKYRAIRPDLLVLDLRLPVIDGVDVVRRLITEVPEACILIVTTYDTDEDIYNSLKAGAKGYLLKDSSRDVIKEAVTEVLNGGSYTPAKIASKLVSRINATPLSPRELEVLRLVEQGESNKEISDKLSIGAGTVKTHVANLLNKLDARCRTEAVSRARERGLIV